MSTVIPPQLQEHSITCRASEKPLLLLHLLSTLQMDRTLVFASSVETTTRLYKLLKLFGSLRVQCVSSARKSQENARTLAKFQKACVEHEGFAGMVVLADSPTVAMQQHHTRVRSGTNPEIELVTLDEAQALATQRCWAAELREAANMLPLIGVALMIGLAIVVAGYLLASLSFVWRLFTPNRFLADLVASAIRFIAVIFAAVMSTSAAPVTSARGAKEALPAA